MRRVASWKLGIRLSARPIRKITAARRARVRNSAKRLPVSWARRLRERVMASPAAKRKNGKIRSVKVQPFHSA